jgi:hypothetical protein
MKYWLNLFTGTTWAEFQKSGSSVTGFRDHNWKRAERIKPGDTFLCYMVGVSRWVGLLEITGTRYKDDSKIWGEEIFPVRFPVKPLIILAPEQGVPMAAMEGKLSYFPKGGSVRKWSGHVRASPTRYKQQDGDALSAAIRAAEVNPVHRPVDAKALGRSANLYKRSTSLYKTTLKSGKDEVETVVGVPTYDDEEELAEESTTPTTPGPTHTEIQFRLLQLGSQMGLKVWAPKSDRGKSWNGHALGTVERLLQALPTNFDDATNGIVENIDVIWLSEENAIVAAFEVEHSTAIYSGLLRMSDLLTMQPNIDIKLYIVGPDERYDKFKKEVPRPTFALRKKALHSVCGFVPYSQLCACLDQHKPMLQYMKPEFLDQITEYYDPRKEFDE